MQAKKTFKRKKTKVYADESGDKLFRCPFFNSLVSIAQCGFRAQYNSCGHCSICQLGKDLRSQNEE